jgi:hypothetical protein
MSPDGTPAIPPSIRAMSRRLTPHAARIYHARRVAVLNRLTQERRPSWERAEALVAGWEAEGDARGMERMTAAFWDAGPTCMLEQRGRKN